MVHQVTGEEWASDPFKLAHGLFTTVDTVIVNLLPTTRELNIAVIQRTGIDQGGRQAIPGGHIAFDARIHDASVDESREETGIDISGLLWKKLESHDDPERSPYKRVIGFSAVAFGVNLPNALTPAKQSDARKPMWAPVKGIERQNLAFEGDQMVAASLRTLRQHFDTHAPVEYLPQDFTVDDLVTFYETMNQGSIVQTREFERRLHVGLAIDNDKGRSPAGRPYLKWVVPKFATEPGWNIDISSLMLSRTTDPVNFAFTP